MKFVTACFAASVRLAGALAPLSRRNGGGISFSSLQMAESADDGIILNKWSRYVEKLTLPKRIESTLLCAEDVPYHLLERSWASSHK
jgi:hypothetical protein